jgi:hypothetical protein
LDDAKTIIADDDDAAQPDRRHTAFVQPRVTNRKARNATDQRRPRDGSDGALVAFFQKTLN